MSILENKKNLLGKKILIFAAHCCNELHPKVLYLAFGAILYKGGGRLKTSKKLQYMQEENNRLQNETNILQEYKGKAYGSPRHIRD